MRVPRSLWCVAALVCARLGYADVLITTTPSHTNTPTGSQTPTETPTPSPTPTATITPTPTSTPTGGPARPTPWSAGGAEIQVNATTTGNQLEPSVALGANNGFIVAWTSDGQDGDGHGIFARRFDAAGAPAGVEFQVNTSTAHDQYSPSIASDPAGNFVVVWSSYVAAGQYTDVKARRFDATGAALGGEFQVNTFTTGYQLAADVAMNSAGFIVTWQSLPVGLQEPQDGDQGGIFARRYDASGNALSAEFLVNTQTASNQALPAVALNESGRSVIVWTGNDQDGAASGIFGQQFAGASPVGDEFAVNTYTTGVQIRPAVAIGSASDFIVTWQSAPQDGSGDGIYGRAFDLTGAAIGQDFLVNTYTTGGQSRSEVAKFSDLPGGFVAVWDSFGPDGSPGNIGVSAQRFANAPAPTAAFYYTQPPRRGVEYSVNSYTTNAQFHPDIAMHHDGRFVVVWESFNQDGDQSGIVARQFGFPVAGELAVDRRASGGASNVNGVLEPGERVTVDPTWSNPYLAPELPLAGSAANLLGPPGATYAIDDPGADYGTIPTDSSADCFHATGDCYEVSVSETRPLAHWDATFDELVGSPSLRAGIPADTKTWALHVGGTFPDVPTDGFYPSIEALAHSRVTAGGGCGPGLFCGDESVLRQQMAVFLVKSQLGAEFVPPPATGEVFDDVPASSPFAPWIEELARQQVTGGCSSPPPPALPSFCPTAPVNRQQMAVFLVKTLWGNQGNPAGCSGLFADVDCSNPFAPWIEYLVGTGVTAGCNANPPLYCPARATTRKQMAVFLVKTFGLQLYGPD